MTIGDNIRAYRKKAGLSQRELGEKIGMSQQQLAQYESNIRTPKADNIKRIADALGVPMVQLAPPEVYTAQMDFFEPVLSEMGKKLPAGYVVRSGSDMEDLWIEYPDGDTSKDLSLSDLQTAINKAMDYLKFELEQFRKDKP